MNEWEALVSLLSLFKRKTLACSTCARVRTRDGRMKVLTNPLHPHAEHQTLNPPTWCLRPDLIVASQAHTFSTRASGDMNMTVRKKVTTISDRRTEAARVVCVCVCLFVLGGPEFVGGHPAAAAAAATGAAAAGAACTSRRTKSAACV